MARSATPQVFSLIHPTAELMPVSPYRSAGGDQSPLRLRGYMDGPASRASIPPPAAFREAR